MQDASEYIDKININRKIVGYIVSTNDLSYNSADDVIKQSKAILDKTISKCLMCYYTKYPNERTQTVNGHLDLRTEE